MKLYQNEPSTNQDDANPFSVASDSDLMLVGKNMKICQEEEFRQTSRFGMTDEPTMTRAASVEQR